MNRRIRDLRNLGPKTEQMLAEADVFGEDDLRDLGPVLAYQRFKFRVGRNVSLIALYAIAAALRNCDWRDLDKETKRRLRDQANGTG